MGHFAVKNCFSLKLYFTLSSPSFWASCQFCNVQTCKLRIFQLPPCPFCWFRVSKTFVKDQEENTKIYLIDSDKNDHLFFFFLLPNPSLSPKYKTHLATEPNHRKSPNFVKWSLIGENSPSNQLFLHCHRTKKTNSKHFDPLQSFPKNLGLHGDSCGEYLDCGLKLFLPLALLWGTPPTVNYSAIANCQCPTVNCHINQRPLL